MLPSLYIQIFNTAGNFLELLMITTIALLTYKSNKDFEIRAISVNEKLDRLLILTNTLKKAETIAQKDPTKPSTRRAKTIS